MPYIPVSERVCPDPDRPSFYLNDCDACGPTLSNIFPWGEFCNICHSKIYKYHQNNYSPADQKTCRYSTNCDCKQTIITMVQEAAAAAAAADAAATAADAPADAPAAATPTNTNNEHMLRCVALVQALEKLDQEGEDDLIDKILSYYHYKSGKEGEEGEKGEELPEKIEVPEDGVFVPAPPEEEEDDEEDDEEGGEEGGEPEEGVVVRAWWPWAIDVRKAPEELLLGLEEWARVRGLFEPKKCRKVAAMNFK